VLARAAGHGRESLTAAFAQKGFKLVRAHAYNETEKHGFISSQRQGMDVFMKIHPEAKLVFATAAWQYSHHVLPGLRSHKGPILTVANWSGQWPGLVGLLNLNGSLTKAGKKFSSIWSKDFTDEFSLKGAGRVAARRQDHPRSVACARARQEQAARRERGAGRGAGRRPEASQGHHGHLRRRLHGHVQRHHRRRTAESAGIFKERLSQSALVAKMRTVSDAEARGVYDWLVGQGREVRLRQGLRHRADPGAGARAVQDVHRRGAHRGEFGCDVIGIQYQQGLKDMVPRRTWPRGC
jgi:hypothetical protein